MNRLLEKSVHSRSRWKIRVYVSVHSRLAVWLIIATHCRVHCLAIPLAIDSSFSQMTHIWQEGSESLQRTQLNLERSLWCLLYQGVLLRAVAASLLYAWWRCLLPSQKWLLSSAPPGCHKAWPSVVLVLATCPASEHHAINWQCCSRCSAVRMSALHRHISDSPTLNLLYMWALSVLCPVLSLNGTTCSGLFSL